MEPSGVINHGTGENMGNPPISMEGFYWNIIQTEVPRCIFHQPCSMTKGYPRPVEKYGSSTGV